MNLPDAIKKLEDAVQKSGDLVTQLEALGADPAAQKAAADLAAIVADALAILKDL